MREDFYKQMVRWFVVLLFLVIMTTPALAHTPTLKSSTPANGAIIAGNIAQVTAHFDEELKTKASTLKVVDAGGIVVSTGNGSVDLDDPDHATLIATLTSTLPDGLYTAQWHVLLGDGDASDGSFAFTVDAKKAVSATNEITPMSTATSPSEPIAVAANPATQPAEKRPDTLSLGQLFSLAVALPALGLLFNRLRPRRR